MPTHDEHEKQRALLAQLRVSRDAVAHHQAVQLQRLYHDREMAVLSTDIYDDAKGVGQPPPGWLRGSEHLDLLRRYAPQLRLSDTELRRLLKPEESGFRADIYLPDPAELGPGYQPTVVFKGSSGQVLTEHGLRDTTIEDFAANNGPQSIGMKTDYYTRAMNLAASLKSARINFQLAGHSLGGGLATAASAVTGMPATVFNAAALHPNTARRFVQDNPGVQLYDLSHRVNGYEVRNELLTAGLQDSLRDMPGYSRQQLAAVLQDASGLLQRLPDARALLQNALQQGVPLASQPVVNDFVARLARGDVDSLLRDMPPPVGEVHLLAALTERDGHLVPRTEAMPLHEVAALADPLLTVLNTAMRGANAGAAVGTVHAGPLHAVGDVLNLMGDGARAGGEAAGAGLHAQIRADAMQQALAQQSDEAITQYSREAMGAAQAGLERELGQAQRLGGRVDAAILRGAGHLVPGRTQAWLGTQADQLEQAGRDAAERHQQHAEAAARAVRQANIDRHVAQHQRAAAEEKENQQAADALRDHAIRTGQELGDRLDAAADRVHTLAGHVTTADAAAVGMAAGAAGLAVTAATVVPVQHDPARPDLTPDAMKLAELAKYAMPAGTEALDRHLMEATVLPSIEGQVQQAEQAAQQRLQRMVPAHVHEAVQPAQTPPSPRVIHESAMGRAAPSARSHAEPVKTALAEAPAQSMRNSLDAIPAHPLETSRDTSMPHASRGMGRHPPLPANASAEQILDHLGRAMESGDNRLFMQALKDVGRTDFSQEFHAQAAERVAMEDRQVALEAQLQQTQQQLAAQQQTRSHVKVMSR